MGTTEIDQLRVPIENTYKTAVAGSYPPCGYVFFVNFKANQEALKYFMFNKGKRQDLLRIMEVQMLLRHVVILPNTTITVQKVILGTYLTVLTLQKESSALLRNIINKALRLVLSNRHRMFYNGQSYLESI